MIPFRAMKITEVFYLESLELYDNDQYDCRLAMTAVKTQSPSVKATVLRQQSLWSDAEEQVLANIPSVGCYNNHLITSS